MEVEAAVVSGGSGGRAGSRREASADAAGVPQGSDAAIRRWRGDAATKPAF